MTSVLVGAPGSGRSAQPGLAQRLIHNPNKEAGCSGTKATSCRRGWEKAGPKESHPPLPRPHMAASACSEPRISYPLSSQRAKDIWFSGQELLASFLLAISSTARCKYRTFLENNKIVGAQALPQKTHLWWAIPRVYGRNSKEMPWKQGQSHRGTKMKPLKIWHFCMSYFLPPLSLRQAFDLPCAAIKPIHKHKQILQAAITLVSMVLSLVFSSTSHSHTALRCSTKVSLKNLIPADRQLLN